MLQLPDRPRRLSQTAWISISSATTARRRRSRISSPVSPKASGRDLSQFFRWYQQAGTPKLTARGALRCGGEDLYARSVAKLRADARPARARSRCVMPIALGLSARDGRKSPLVQDNAGEPAREPSSRASSNWPASAPDHLQGRAERARFLRCCAAFRRPCVLDYDLERRRSAAADGPRQRHVQPLAGGADLRHPAADPLDPAIRAGEAPEFRPGFAEALGAADRRRAKPTRPSRRRWSPCRAKPTSRATSARTSIPTRSSWRAATLARRSSASSRASPARRLCDELRRDAPYSPDAASAGRRALRNACLDLYAAGDPVRRPSSPCASSRPRDNMTDEIAALRRARPHSRREREQALEFFLPRRMPAIRSSSTNGSRCRR